MRPDSDLRQLAADVVDRARNNPYVLFLGDACARAALVPTSGAMALRVFGRMYESQVDSYYSALASKHLPRELYVRALSDAAVHSELVEPFYRLLADLPPISRDSLIRGLYDELPVPPFYRDVARLLQRRAFTRVLTTSVDTLLEQALDEIGERRGLDYAVLSPPLLQPGKRDVRRDPPVTIVKLYGDLAQEQFVDLTFGEPEMAKRLLLDDRATLRAEIKPGAVVVGYEPRGRLLEKVFYRLSGSWWVNASQESCDSAMSFGDVRCLFGDRGAPEVFFPDLYALVQVMEDAERRSQRRPPQDRDDPGVVAVLEDDDALEVEMLKRQLDSTRQDMAQMTRQVAPTKGGSLRQEQLALQRLQVVRLENQLRQLTTTTGDICGVLEAVAAALEGDEPDAAAFVRSQSDLVGKQYASDKPNEVVIGAALGAVQMLVDSLGGTPLDPELAQELRGLRARGPRGGAR